MDINKILLTFFFLCVLGCGYSVRHYRQKYEELETEYWQVYNVMHELDYSLMICKFLNKKCTEEKCK